MKTFSDVYKRRRRIPSPLVGDGEGGKTRLEKPARPPTPARPQKGGGSPTAPEGGP